MNVPRLRVIARVSIPIALSILLSACGSLSPTHSDGRRLPESKDSYYAPAAVVEKKSGYLNVWRAGDLAGVCDSESEVSKHNFAVSDNIFIELDELYKPRSNELSEKGMAKLDQMLGRISQYQDVARVEIHGLTQKSLIKWWRRNIDHTRNDVLSTYLRLNLDEEIPLRIVSERDTRDLESRSSEVRRVFNKKVFARVFAKSVRDDTSSITMCTPRAADAVLKSLSEIGAEKQEPVLTKYGLFEGPMMLSMGDRVRIRVPEDTDIEGIYEIDADGYLDVPYAGRVKALGLRVDELEESVTQRLVDEAIIHEDFAMLDISVLQWSVADVFVSGAVFNPGRKTINGLKIELKTFKQTQTSGDAARERFLSNALVIAGGVRPDADISNIVIRRRGEILNVNMEGILSGDPVPDISLITGDEIYVPTTGRFRKELARVSQITPQGLRLFVSNLSTPRNPNQVDGDATKLPYGTRLLHVLLSANCVGGTQLTNSAKKALLITVNPVTQVTEIIERDIQQLVSDPDRDHVNPYLMPNDGIACYDSNVTNYRDFARTVTDILSPLSLLKTLIGD